MNQANFKLMIPALMLIFTITAVSAQKINFSGSYAINKSKINFGQAPEWTLPSGFEVEQKDDRLIITRTTVDQSGKETSRKLDFQPGQATEYTTTVGDKNKCTVAWNDDQSGFTLTVQSTKADGTAGQSYEEVWSLDSGKTLLINRSVAQANGMKYIIKAVYDKK